MQNLNYGVIGNCKTAALISEKASLDWCCLPVFDSSSVFAKLLDTEKGGSFEVLPEGEARIGQRYLEDTNILVTTFELASGSFELIDFMPVFPYEDGSLYCPADIVRFIRILSGKPEIRIRYNPRLSYAQSEVQHDLADEYIKSYTRTGTYESVYLYSDLDLHGTLRGDVLTLDRNCFFLLSYNEKVSRLDVGRINLDYQKTKVFWMDWAAAIPRFPAHHNDIVRSALVLKLLTYQPTGAILAAVTTSLPETIGSVRNWDYRYCWIRDSSMIINTLINLSHTHEAKRFLDYVLRIIPFKDEKIQIMYGINGEKRLKEIELPHLAGYENSRPVRIGNAAYTQKQNDIYGVLMDVIYQDLVRFPNNLDRAEELWTMVRTLVRTVKNNWIKPDKGIWEFRSQKRHFTFSKVLCWVAIDRAIRIAHMLRKKNYALEWSRLRDAIKLDILKKGWKPELRAFTQAYENDQMDAANLLMEQYGFIGADDPKYVSTVERIWEELVHDGLMFRYRNKDDFGEPTTAFTVCTFWMIRALYKIGRRTEAETMFESVLKYRNHLGLYSEGVDFATGRLLGNFPQGYSHLALIDTASVLAGQAPRDENKIIFH